MRRVVLTGEDLHIRYPFHEELKAIVSQFPGRRYDGQDCKWIVPVAHVREVVNALECWDFSFDEETLARYEQAGGRAAGEASAALALSSDDYTISRLNRDIEQTLRSQFPDKVWLVGELADYDQAARSGKDWRRFKLVERNGDLHELAAVIAPHEGRRLERRLAESGVRLEDGLQVRVQVLVRMMSRWGKLELRIQDIDPTYTLGAAAKRRLEIVKRLAAAGLLGANRDRPLPVCPLRVGVITKIESDAFHDVIQTLVESGYAFHYRVAGTRVQGPRTEETTLAALAHLRARAAELDVVLVCRGGGSQTDLGWFDSEALAQAVAAFPLPVLVGIGHEADRSVLDEVGRSYKTPTAAAQAVVEQVRRFHEEVQERGGQIGAAAQLRVAAAQAFCAQWLQRVRAQLRPAWKGEQATLEKQVRRLQQSARRALQAEQGALRAQAQVILNTGQRQKSAAQRALRQVGPRLLRAAGPLIRREQSGMKAAEQRVRAADPQNILNRGFAILRMEDGVVVTQAQAVRVGMPLVAQLREGELRLRSEGPVPRKKER